MFEPLLHWYVNPVPAFALKFTLEPLQNVVDPLAVIVAVGNAFTSTAVVVLVAEQPLAFATVTL